jgi:hypothetical protein
MTANDTNILSRIARMATNDEYHIPYGAAFVVL